MTPLAIRTASSPSTARRAKPACASPGASNKDHPSCIPTLPTPCSAIGTWPPRQSRRQRWTPRWNAAAHAWLRCTTCCRRKAGSPQTSATPGWRALAAPPPTTHWATPT
ncbi:hypothetical protein G6F50_016474 [Rhizopus delemar]|uniref:Uncharacterized protein n=1 Tax=Rhizopus delemar TaxID=936053 RepID=A0A9P6XSV6_9FUNG|nr:hypothetical protein G6F50_016474 [Rhizopus delemar]